MDKINIGELVDAFLKNTISPQDRELLQELMDKDPAIKELVEESLKTYDFLQYLRYQQIRQNLREIDEKGPGDKKRIPPRLWVLLSLLALILGITGWISLIKFYSPESLAIRNIESISTDIILTDQSPGEVMLNLNLAEVYFKNRDYQNAARLYQPLSETVDENIRDQVKWNVLMCHLAQEGPTPRWKESLNRFTAQSNHVLQEKGQKILRLLNSSFYGVFIYPSSGRFSGMRPTLM